MKKVIGNFVFESHTAKESRMLNKLEKMMNPEKNCLELKRFKVVFYTKKGLFYRVLDGLDELDACNSTGVKNEQIISVVQVSEKTECTKNKPLEVTA